MDDLFVTPAKRPKAKFTGTCKYHPRFFNTEITLERYAPPSLGYYVCEDCKRQLRKEREQNYFRKNGKPLRKHISNTDMAWDKKTKRFVKK